MPMELLPLSWSVASRFGRGAGGRNGLLLTQPGLASHLEVQVRTQLCVISPPKRTGMTSGCSLSRSHGPTKPTQVEGLPNTTRATAWAVGMEADLAWGKFL